MELVIHVGRDVATWENPLGQTFIKPEGKQVSVNWHSTLNSWMHSCNGVPEALAGYWDNVPLSMLMIATDNSAVTAACDGDFGETAVIDGVEVRISATVDTVVMATSAKDSTPGSGVLVHRIRVRLILPDDAGAVPTTPLLRFLREWYNELRAGNKNSLVKLAVIIPDQPAAAAAHQ